MNNPFTAALVILVILIIVLFMIIRNKADRKDLEENLNEDYNKFPKDRRSEKI